MSLWITDYNLRKNNWFELFSACLGRQMAIQEAFSRHVVKGQNWNVDFGTGTISFGNSPYPVQFIGSESSLSNTWKWGWDNINGFDNRLLELAHEAKEKGGQWELEPLSIANFQLDQVFNGHNLSVVACAISEKPYCYYRGPHDGGAVFMGISGVPEAVFAPVKLHEFITISMQCIQTFHVDHKIFIESFLNWNKIDYSWENETIVAEFSQRLKIKFEKAEEFLRIASMKSEK